MHGAWPILLTAFSHSRLSPPHLSPLCAWEVQSPVIVTQDVTSWKGDQLDIPYQFFFFFFDTSFIYFWLGLVFTSHGLSLGAAGRGYSSCAVEASHMVASHCGARALGRAGFTSGSPQAGSLQHMGLVTLRHMGSSQTRDRTHVPCIGRPILTIGPPGKPSAILMHTVLTPFRI